MGRAPAGLPDRRPQERTYLLTYFRTDGENLKEIVADCRLSDVIVRELVLKVTPSWSTTWSTRR